MSIVVDLNTLPSVFDPYSTDHAQFKPVHNWILFGRGRAVFGGSKYKLELTRTFKYLRLFRRLKEAHRAIEIKQDMVDAKEAKLIESTEGKDCDDQHLIAILCVSRCILLCSQDKRSYKFIKTREFYDKDHRGPKIYSSLRNATLLSDENIVRLLHTS
jgi:hypothetical protein